jgi:hypothetical protein
VKLNEVLAIETELASDLDAIRRVKGILERRLQAKAQRQLPAKLRAAQKLRTPAAPEYPSATAQILAMVETLQRQKRPVTLRAIREAGVPGSGIASALLRYGYKSKGGVWKLTKRGAAMQAKRAQRQAKPKKGHASVTIATILKNEGRAMTQDDLIAAAKKLGAEVSPQAFGAALRYGYIKANGDGYVAGDRA